MKMQIIVMPAWIAGIQVRKDASANIHVSLGSSTPCWNDAKEGFWLNSPRLLQARIFKEGHEEPGSVRFKRLERFERRSDYQCASLWSATSCQRTSLGITMSAERTLR
jgi:hypothetical protein